jgi:putative membrane protein
MNIYGDAAVSWLHYMLIFAVIAALVGELVLCRAPLSPEAVRRLSRFDLPGLSALLLLIVGFARALHFAKGWAFYAAEPWFWVKIGAFALVGLLSIFPTMEFIRWNRAAKNGTAPAPDEARLRTVRRTIHLELALLPVIVLAAVMMARGL